MSTALGDEMPGHAALVRVGVERPDGALEYVGTIAREWHLAAADVQDLIGDVALAADPDAALRLMAGVAESSGPAGRGVFVDPDARRRLLDVLGVSEALGVTLARHPELLDVITNAEALVEGPGTQAMQARLLLAIGADPLAAEPIAPDASDDRLDALRVAYRREVLGIVTRDLSGLAQVDIVSTWLADLAGAVLEAALAFARAAVPSDAAPCRLAVIGMGKCGGRELNYVSDVDVIFVAEPVPGVSETDALRTATLLATSMMRACTVHTAEGSIWEVDAALRPEGKQGALVRTLDSHLDYYQRWAKTWEFQALLKARVVAGDRELGQRYVDAVAPLVWNAAAREGFVAEVQDMRRRVEAHVPARIAAREIKLGAGGLRDVEFSVQLLQLVHGRGDAMLRSPNTLAALEALATWGYVGRDDAATLADAYRFLRSLEHRIQLHHMRRTHTLPEDDAALRRLGRSLGLRADPVAELDDLWRRHARQARRLHEKLFYRPLLNAVARLEPGEVRLTLQAAKQRLHALGYADPAGALRHLEALTSGVSRRAAIQRTLLPVLLGWFADAPDPDAGLLAFRRVSEALGSTHWYLGLLRDESAAAERLARILASSRLASELLLQAPDCVGLLAAEENLLPRSREALVGEAHAAAQRHDSAPSTVIALRSLRRRELFRLAAGDVLGVTSLEAIQRGLTDVTAATIGGALDAVRQASDAPPIRFAVIGMGRFGGGELGYGSDADVMFAYDPLPGVAEEDALRWAFAIANDLRTLLMAPSTDPPLDIDADLRPEGRQGPLVRSLASYAAYYARWSSVWEAQALLRAQPVCGDADLGADFVALINPLRYPVEGIPAGQLREIRRLKARMEAERLPRGADPALHAKLGRGGLSDVEWVVQLLQMQHAGDRDDLRVTGTLAALTALHDAGLIQADDAQALASAWIMATRLRNATMLVRGRASDMVPTNTSELAAMAFVLGRTRADPGALLEEYRRLTRRARLVTERLFYGSVTA